MGDTLSKIDDMYDDYKLLCQKHNETPVDIFEDWFKHLKKLKEYNEDKKC